MFVEKGFKNTVITDIMNASRLSTGGIYHHYKSTDEILYDIIEEDYKKLEDYLDELLSVNKNTMEPKRLAEIIAEKVLEEIAYIPIYTMFLCELNENEKLKKLFYELKKKTIQKLREYI